MTRLSHYLVVVFAFALAGLLTGADAVAVIVTQAVMSLGLVAI